eukprot:Tbor_TRINITY_DN6071_c0_g2::TRINITY_DN6071_c0_g2_i1::g.11472::m.11472
MGNESVRSSNISDNADTPFMYPMLAPVHYVRYESSSLESSMQTPPRFSSCSSLLRRDAHEYTAIIRDSINFYDYPKYNMPWYFKTNQESWIESTSSNEDGAAKGQTSSGIRNSSRGTDSVYNSSDGIEGTVSSTVSDSDDQVYHSTMPLCGRTLVRFLENPAPGVPKHFSYDRKGNKYTQYLPKRSNGGVSVPLRHPTDLLFSKAIVWEKEEPIPMKAKSLEEYYKEPVEHQFSVHRVVLRDNNEQAVSINGSGSCSVSRMGHPSEQFARVFATANTFFSQRIYIENCGGSGREEKDIFIHARLIGKDRVL